MSTKKELFKQSLDLSPSDFLDLHISTVDQLLVVSCWFQTANQQPTTNNQQPTTSNLFTY